MRTLGFILLVTMALLAAACDPFKADQIEAQAQADALAITTEQQALDQTQQREHQEQLNIIEQAKATLRYEQMVALWQNTKPQLMAAAQMWVILLAAGGAVAFIYLSHHGVVEGKRLMTGMTNALVLKAEIKARMITLDKETGQFPAIYMGHGQIAVGDINTGHVMTFDTRHDGVPQMIAGATAIRHTGVATRNTARAKKDVAESVPLAAQPPIIDATFDGAKFSDFYNALFGGTEVNHDQ